MKTGLILTFGGFGFIVLLLISYYLQEKINSTGSKLYRQLMIIVLFLIISEIIASIYFLKYGDNYVYNVLLHIHWLTCFLWFWGLYLYSICFLRDITVDSITKLILYDFRGRIVSIFTIICIIIFMFLPFQSMTYENFNYMPGIAAYFSLGYASLILFLIIILMFKRSNEINSRFRNAVWIMFAEMIITLVLQLIFPKTALWGLASTLQMYFLYFYIENPDLMMVSRLKKLNDEIEKSSLAKSDFLSNMSHEIRSPMNAIVGFSETILNNPNYDPEQTKSDIEHITTSGNNLLDIINNILDISKIESGSETLEPKEYSIGNIIMELGSIIEARLANRPIKFVAEVDNMIPCRLYGDSTKLFQVLLNILTNSIKYTEVGKIKIEVTKELKINEVLLKFKISDTGYGIKKDDYDKLFEKFSRLKSATTNEIEGTGLGLAITKRYVDLLGGKIWFESDYGVGTTFFVELTQRIIDPTPIGNIREDNNQGKDVELLDCSGKKALVVDDNELNLKVAKKVLEKYNFEIDTLTSGKECVYKIKEGKTYDIIFLDHMMPEMDGIEVVHILKKLEDYKIPPIVVLTANAITGVRAMYLREGFDEYLSKPINRSELNRVIRKFLK